MTYNRRYYFDEDYLWVDEPNFTDHPQLTAQDIEMFLTEIPKRVEQYLNPVEPDKVEVSPEEFDAMMTAQNNNNN